MRAILVILGLVAIAVVVLMQLGLLSMSGGSLPTVAVQPGAAPQVDVGRVDVGTTTRTVEVPKIQVEKADNAAAAQ